MTGIYCDVEYRKLISNLYFDISVFFGYNKHTASDAFLDIFSLCYISYESGC